MKEGEGIRTAQMSLSCQSAEISQELQVQCRKHCEAKIKHATCRCSVKSPDCMWNAATLQKPSTSIWQCRKARVLCAYAYSPSRQQPGRTEDAHVAGGGIGLQAAPQRHGGLIRARLPQLRLVGPDPEQALLRARRRAGARIGRRHLRALMLSEDAEGHVGDSRG